MRSDDIRRYCWPCSTEAGYLIQRHAPALERKRKDAKTKRQAAEQRQRERVRAIRHAREVVDGVDVGKEIVRLIKLPALRDELPEWMRGRRVPWTLHRGSGVFSGHAASRSYVHLTFGSAHAATVKMVLCHELAHYVLPDSEHHTGRWARCYARAVREAYGVDVRPRRGERTFALDRRVVEALGGEYQGWVEE
jgi:hypothetical protein